MRTDKINSTQFCGMYYAKRLNPNVTQTQISCIEMTHEPQKHDTNFDHFGSKSDINGLILEVE